jgi:hypothetical protein
MTEQRPKPFRVETPVDAPEADVWAALTEPERIREWFGWDYAGLDDEIQEIFVQDATAGGGRLTFTDGSYLELVSDGPRTIVRAVLPGPLDDAEWADDYDVVEEGWRVFFEQLRFLLEARPAGRRHTVTLTGVGTAAQALAAVEDHRPPRDRRHTSRYATVAVDADGHLVAFLAQHPLDGDAEGPVSVTVSTYGLDDAAFRAVHDGWAKRWAAAVTEPKATSDYGETALDG